MHHIILLAFASAGSLTVQLLAVVLVILTRPHPKALLWAFWLSALILSCAFSAVALAVFRSKGKFLGTTSRSVSPAIYLVVGVVAVAIALFAFTNRGRELIGRAVDRRKHDESPAQDSVSGRVRTKVEATKSKAEEAMKRGSVWVAIAAGFVLGAPSPFSLAAVGLMVRDGYRLPVQLVLILVFSLITYLVVEVPVLSYVISPKGTATRVEAFSTWLGTHKIQAVATVAAIVGLVLIGKGLTTL